MLENLLSECDEEQTDACRVERPDRRIMSVCRALAMFQSTLLWQRDPTLDKQRRMRYNAMQFIAKALQPCGFRFATLAQQNVNRHAHLRCSINRTSLGHHHLFRLDRGPPFDT